MTPYFDLSDEQFEQIVVAIGQRLFGAGLIGFVKGKDGGRDAKFQGTAERYPSHAAPWTDCTIIQSKHTNGVNAAFSDPAFCNFAKRTGIVFDELPKIQALVRSNEAQNYLLVSNRKLSGLTQARLVQLIADETGLDKHNVAVLGTQQLDDLLELLPEAKASISINHLQAPLIVRPDDLAEVIEGFKEAVELGTTDEDRSVPTPRTSMTDKNPINNMSDEFSDILQKYYFQEMVNIRRFLYHPINEHYKAIYQEAVEEFQLKIIAKRDDFDTFDNMFNHLYELLVDRSGILRSNRKLTRTILYYMYWNCDIGRDKDDQAV